MSRRHLRLFTAVLFFELACGTTGGGGCSGGCGATTRIAAEPAEDTKTYNAIQARLRPEAFDFIQTKFQPILKGMFPPDGNIVIDVPPTAVTATCTCPAGNWRGGRCCAYGGWVYNIFTGNYSCAGLDLDGQKMNYIHACPTSNEGPIYDGGNYCGNAYYNPYGDWSWYSGHGHCKATVVPKALAINRQNPNRLNIVPTVDATSKTWNPDGAIVVAGDIEYASILPVGWLLGPFDCFVKLHALNKKPTVPLNLLVDSRNHALHYDLDNSFTLNGLVTGADFEIYGCTLGDFGQNIQDFLQSTFGFDLYGWLINSVILPLAKGQVDTAVDSAILDMTGMPCHPSNGALNYYTGGCPAAYPGATCQDYGSGKYFCATGSKNTLHKHQGMVGEMDLGAFVAAMGAEPMPTEVFVSAGQKDSVATSPFIPSTPPAGLTKLPLDVRVTGALHPLAHSPCVPLRPAPSLSDVTTFDNATWAPPTGKTSYMVGLGIAETFMNRSMYEMWDGGMFCLNLGTATSSLLSTGLFRALLPSLGTLTEDKDAPMLLAMRPKDVPSIGIGRGTFHKDGSAYVLDEPLLSINIPKMEIGFYALVLDRYVELFSLQTDIGLNLALEVDSNNALRPILGKLDELATNIHVGPAEILSEDPAILEKLVPTLISFAEPMLASAIAPITLPVVQNFKLKVVGLEGKVEKSGEPGRFQTLGLFADLEYQCPQGQVCARYTVDTRAELVGQRIPTSEEIRAALGHDLPRPVARLDARRISTRMGDGPEQFSWRADGGLWSPWIESNTIEVVHPIFLVQGRHTIDVVSRAADDPSTIDPSPARVDFLVDWEPPRAWIDEDVETGALRADAVDVVSPKELLRWSWRVGEGAWTGPEREPPRLSVDDTGGEALQVKVVDEAGNEAIATSAGWGDLQGFHGKTSPSTGGGCGGCGGDAGSVAWLLALCALPLLRRRPAQGRDA